MKKKIHLQYTGTGYTDVGICQPYDWRSKKVTNDSDKVNCKLCRKYINK